MKFRKEDSLKGKKDDRWTKERIKGKEKGDE